MHPTRSEHHLRIAMWDPIKPFVPSSLLQQTVLLALGDQI